MKFVNHQDVFILNLSSLFSFSCRFCFLAERRARRYSGRTYTPSTRCADTLENRKQRSRHQLETATGTSTIAAAAPAAHKPPTMITLITPIFFPLKHSGQLP